MNITAYLKQQQIGLKLIFKDEPSKGSFLSKFKSEDFEKKKLEN